MVTSCVTEEMWTNEVDECLPKRVQCNKTNKINNKRERERKNETNEENVAVLSDKFKSTRNLNES